MGDFRATSSRQIGSFGVCSSRADIPASKDLDEVGWDGGYHLFIYFDGALNTEGVVDGGDSFWKRRKHHEDVHQEMRAVFFFVFFFWGGGGEHIIFICFDERLNMESVLDGGRERENERERERERERATDRKERSEPPITRKSCKYAGIPFFEET